MRRERPFLTARWTDLLMLNFAVPADVIARLAPRGTEPDEFDGVAYVSVVGFLFRNAGFFGWTFPGHRRFEEVNLRYYVRRNVGGQVRRGVVFVREIASRPTVATVARWIYNESYVTRRMRSDIRTASDTLAPGDTVGYEWRDGWWGRTPWNRMAGCVAEPLRLAEPGSLTEYIVEHYWAFVRRHDGGTSEYRVAHRPWRVATAKDVVWDCDVARAYGDSPLAEYLAAPPALAFVADGSPVQVFAGRRCDDEPSAATPSAPHLPNRAVPASGEDGTSAEWPASRPNVLSPPH